MLMECVGILEAVVQKAPEPTGEEGGVPVQEIPPQLIHHQENHQGGRFLK
jgi:hypothetical protein